MQRVVSAASLWCVCGTLLFLTGTCGNAQVRSADGTELQAGDFVKSILPEFPVHGNRWNLLRLSLSNSHNKTVDLQVAMYFDVDPQLQYSRRVQIPPSTRIRTWLPILVPEADPKVVVERAFPFHVLVRSLGDSTGLLPDQFGSLQLDRTLQYEGSESATGVIHTPSPGEILDTEMVDAPEAGALEFLLTGRFNSGLRRNWKTLSRGFAAGGQAALESLDHLVLANDDLLNDPQGQNAVRRWLFEGGHLWIMLDRVDSRILELILEDRYHGQELERVELTNIELVDREGKIQSTCEYDTPVKMTRLLIDDVDVLFSVDGWPAAYTTAYGQGRILVTTLGGNGWGRPRPPGETVQDPETDWEAAYVPLPAFEEIMSGVLATDEDSLDLNPVLTTQIEGFIGFQIPARANVAGVLLGYALLSVILAVCLWKTGRLPWFGALAPALGLCAAGTLLGMRPAGRDIPATAVISELVTPTDGSDDVRVQGVVGFYDTESAPLILSGDEGGTMMPDMEGLRSGIRILSYDDQFRWQWEHLSIQPGLHTAEFEWSGSHEPIEAAATLDERGLSGTLTLPAGLVPQDGLIDSAQGRIGVHFTEGGRWTTSSKDTLSREQFLGADLLGDEQRRRVATLQQLMTTPARPWDSHRTHLLFWTRPWESGFEVGENFPLQGTALVALPLQLKRPSAGSRITIPAPLIAYQEVTGPDGKQPAVLYDRRKNEWLEHRTSISTWIGFQIPVELLPLSLNQAKVRIGVTGPVGQLELWKWDGRERVSLRRWDNPVGTLSAAFDETSEISVSDDGKLLLFLSAGEDTFEGADSDDMLRSPWRIEFFDLSLEATAVEPES